MIGSPGALAVLVSAGFWVWIQHHGILLLADAFVVTTTRPNNNKPLLVVSSYLDSLNRGGADGTEDHYQNLHRNNNNDPGNSKKKNEQSSQPPDENIIVFKPIANPGIPSSSSGSYLGRLSSVVHPSSDTPISTSSTTTFPSFTTGSTSAASAIGSYLDQLSAASSTSNTASKKNYAPSSASSWNPTQQSSSSTASTTNDTTRYDTTSSYLGALGKSSSVSPWGNNNKYTKSPWTPPPSQKTGPAHGQAYSQAPSSFVPQTSSVPPADNNSNNNPVKESVIDAVVLDMLDTTKTVYENLHSDIIEGEGFIVSGSSRPDMSSPTATTDQHSSSSYSFTPGIKTVEAELIKENKRQHAAGSYEDFFPPDATQSSGTSSPPSTSPAKQTTSRAYLDTLLGNDDEEEVAMVEPSMTAPTVDDTPISFPDITPNSTWWSDPSSRNLQQQTTPVIPLPEPTEQASTPTAQPTWWDGNSASQFLQKPVKGVAVNDSVSPPQPGAARVARGMKQPIERVPPYETEAKTAPRNARHTQTTTPPPSTTTTSGANVEAQEESVTEEEDYATLRDKHYMQMIIDLVLEK
jgi:hypothetical protein